MCEEGNPFDSLSLTIIQPKGPEGKSVKDDKTFFAMQEAIRKTGISTSGKKPRMSENHD